MEYKRPGGDITTVLDRATRDGQDGTFFPLDTAGSWFYRDEIEKTFPTTMTTQEFAHRGAAEWGGRFTFDVNALQAGDLLHAVAIQVKVGHWYDSMTIAQMQAGNYMVDMSSNPWTYVESFGTSLIEYAEFEVGDKTIERIDGEFIRANLAMMSDINMQYGVGTDALGTAPLADVAANTGIMNPNRPWTVEKGIYTCILPFFFLRTRLKQVFPLVSCNEGTVRVIVKLRPFADMVRSCTGARESCTDTPLGKVVRFNRVSDGGVVTVRTSDNVPPFLDFRMITYTALISDKIRGIYLRQPFDQILKLVQGFRFDEPMKYIVAKTNAMKDSVNIQLPLELNNPVQEIFWVFRRKATHINNEWGNFRPFVETQVVPGRVVMPWLNDGVLRINGMVVDNCEGEWWRDEFCKSHKGGWIARENYIYGYSFAINPDDHQPSGTANMSRSNSVTLNLTVRTPFPVAVPGGFEADVAQGWEIYVYAMYFNWMRFENGMCGRVFAD